MKNIEHYFATARERERIRQRRANGETPWTEDPIFRQWRFTNVHRENDKTTQWFREQVRSKVSGLRAIEACLIFRWFNRIETGERIKDLLIQGWDTEEARTRLRDVSPLVTGAYMIHSPYGFNKLDGLLFAIDECRPRIADYWLHRDGHGRPRTLASVHAFLETLPNMGEFSAGEVTIDLRYTDVLWNAPDINTWTIAGPGCARGLGYVVADDPKHFNYNSAKDQAVMLPLMQEILALSKQELYWPQAWEPWELHECEMWACEYAKYRSAQDGNRLKRRFSPT